MANNSEEVKITKQNEVIQEGVRCILGSHVINFQALKWTPESM